MTAATASAEPHGDRMDAALLKVAGIVVLGAAASLLDTTIVNVALATLGRDLHSSVATIQWVTTGYLLALALVIPLSGWAVDRFGARPVWMFSLGAFMTGSALCGLAWSVGSLIAFRVLQGVGGGLLLPVGQTVLARQAGPARLARTMALIGIPAQLAPVIGPVIGGLIVVNLSWRWIFYVNVPICVLGIVLAWRWLHTEPGHTGRALDVAGLALLSPGLAATVYGFSRAGAEGFTSTTVLVSLGVGAIMLAAFAHHALTTRVEPIIDLRLFRVRSFAAASAIMFAGGISVFGSLLLLPLYEQIVRGRSALDAGLLLGPQGIGTMLGLLIAGRMGNRAQPRAVVLIGLALTTVGMLPYAVSGAETSEWLLGVALLLRGVGLGLFFVTVLTTAYIGLRSDQIPRASTAVRIFQQVGGSIGTAVLAVILANHLAGQSGPAARASAFDTTFWWALVMTGVAVIPALWLPRRSATVVRSAEQSSG